jgi:competence protein ComEC
MGGLALIIIHTQQSHRRRPWPGILIIAATISLGVLTVNLHNEINFKNHYTKQVLDTESISDIRFKIREVLKPGFYHDKYIIEIFKINDHRSIGKALLNVNIDSTRMTLKVDDIYLARSELGNLPRRLNPHQFDYGDYLKKKYIYRQVTLHPEEVFMIQSKPHTLLGWAASIRAHIIDRLESHNFKKEELDVIKALLLGQRQDISSMIYRDYIRAGAVHILAVSGLHVGILLLLLNYLFNPLQYHRYGRPVKIFMIVIIMWGFAIVAGLSASVVRAVTMFSIITVAINIKRPTNIYNTLAISMFLLLLIKPMFLLDVGFQLSYLAVLAIVSIQPMLYRIWQPNLYVWRYLWQILTVTLSAQIGVVPLSLYYFHQFPGLFFISNLVIIPVLGFILGLGIMVIILASLFILPSFLSQLLGNIISFMNDFVRWIADQEHFLVTDISFGIPGLVMSYLLLSLIIIGLKQKTYKNVVTILLAVLCCQGVMIQSKNRMESAFIVFHKPRHSIIGIHRGDQLFINLDRSDSLVLNERIIAQYKVGEAIAGIKTDSIQSVYEWDNQHILVVDSLDVYKIKSFDPHIVLLRNSPKLNLNRLIDSLDPKLILSDGSNYKSYQDRWALTCAAKNIPFHRTNEKGAYIMSY